MNRAFRVSLFLLLALRMGLLTMLVRSLRVLFGTARVLLALGVVALAVMFGGGTMCLGSVFVVFGSLVVFVLGHGILVGCQLPAGTNPPHPKTFQQAAAQR
jgi:hypothetical protein